MSHEKPYPSNVVMHIKTVILPKKFSFGLINFVNLSTTFFIQGFLTFFYFFHKNAFLTFFIPGVNVLYIYGSNHWPGQDTTDLDMTSTSLPDGHLIYCSTPTTESAYTSSPQIIVDLFSIIDASHLIRSSILSREKPECLWRQQTWFFLFSSASYFTKM